MPSRAFSQYLSQSINKSHLQTDSNSNAQYTAINSLYTNPNNHRAVFFLLAFSYITFDIEQKFFPFLRHRWKPRKWMEKKVQLLGAMCKLKFDYVVSQGGYSSSLECELRKNFKNFPLGKVKEEMIGCEGVLGALMRNEKLLNGSRGKFELKQDFSTC